MAMAADRLRSGGWAMCVRLHGFARTFHRATYSDSEQEILNFRHYSLFTPRDFDLSPYFQTIKPTSWARLAFC